jgi:hypothetical protein
VAPLSDELGMPTARIYKHLRHQVTCRSAAALPAPLRHVGRNGIFSQERLLGNLPASAPASQWVVFACFFLVGLTPLGLVSGRGRELG